MGALVPAAVYKGGKFYFFCQFAREKHAAKTSIKSVRALCQFCKTDNIPTKSTSNCRNVDHCNRGTNAKTMKEE